MHIRRIRTHNHGYSNRSLGYSMSSQSCLFNNPSQIKNNSDAINRKSQLRLPAQINLDKNLKKNTLKKSSVPPFQAEKKLKSMHAAKRSIKKIVKGWNLPQLQTISTGQFHKIITTKLKLPITYQQAQDIVNKYSKNGKLDTKQIIQILFQQHDQAYFNPQLSTSKQQKEKRTRSVNNLLEDLSNFKTPQSPGQTTSNIQINNLLTNYNRFMAKLRKIYPTSKQVNFQEIKHCTQISKVQKESFEKIKNILNQKSCIQAAYNLQDISQQVYYELVNKRYRTGGKQLPVDNYQKQFMPTNTSFYLRSSLTNSKSYLNSMQKSLQLDPKQFTNIDQQKTRFGANPNLLTIDTSQDKQNICCEKQKIDKLLRQQRDKAKIRYENKLQKMRQNRSNQLQRILGQQDKYLKTQQANLLKRGTEQAAYNYVSFIQNQWK